MAMISIAISFLVIILAVTISGGFRKEIRSGIADIAGDIQVSWPEVGALASDNPLNLSQPNLAGLDSIPGVAMVRPAVYRGGTGAGSKEGLDERSRIVIGDDLMKDFDFDSLFSLITSDWPVNPKGQAAYTVPFGKAPKIYLSSNFSVSGDGSSYRARQWPLAFSDYYNEDHQPVQDFGALFFEEWDTDQWTLFWNLVAQCIQIYFRFGYVPAPDSRLEDRRLAQQIGEDFMTWAEEYFAEDAGHLNVRILRQDMYRAFIEHVQTARSSKISYSPKSFSMRLGYYVRLKKYYLNPHLYNPQTKTWNSYDKDGRPIRTDKSNGREFFIVGDSEYYTSHLSGVVAPAPPELTLEFADNDSKSYEK